MRTAGRDQIGATLIELTVSLAIATLLVAGVLTLLEQSQKAYFHTSEATDLQQNLRVGMDRMVRVIQTAGVNPRNERWGGATENDSAFTAIREAGRNCLRIYADLDGDGTVQQTDENVYYIWNSGESRLYEQQGTLGGQPDSGQWWISGSPGGLQELAREIVANPGGTSQFQYFTGPGDATPNVQLSPPGASDTTCNSLSAADRRRIGRVVITLTGRGRVGSETFQRTLTSDARPRNVP